MPASKKIKIQAIGRYSSASAEKGTGKNWDQWIPILEKAGARAMSHQEIVAYLKKKFKITPWWQQVVTGCFEQHTGRRVEGQNLKGVYSVTITRAFPMDQKSLWKLLWSEEGIAAWLNPMSGLTLKTKNEFEVEGGIYGEVRSFRAPERARLSWRDSDWPKATYVQVFIVKRPGQKSILAFMHDNLQSAALKEQMRQHWRAAIQRLEALKRS